MLSVATKHEIARLSSARVCGRCSRAYREIDNLGAWECGFHRDPVGRTCCGENAGCVRADHVNFALGVPHEMRYTARRDRALEVVGEERIGNAPGAYFNAVTNEFVFVRRADDLHRGVMRARDDARDGIDFLRASV